MRVADENFISKVVQLNRERYQIDCWWRIDFDAELSGEPDKSGRQWQRSVVHRADYSALGLKERSVDTCINSQRIKNARF